MFQMNKTQNQQKLLKILNEIFQLDQSDLDFGIYRIMNSKTKEINEFLDNELIASVSKAFSSNDNSSIQKELDDKVKSFKDDGFTEEQIDKNTKIITLREKLSSTSTSSNLENEVFSHLANFFKRYYKDGDFVSLRRYKKDTYAIPYEGEEVKLHWANSDQYYIKSGEYFRDYTFVVNNKTIHFKLSDAQTESNNNKATSDLERRFVILEDNPCEVCENELYIYFEYKAVGKEKQDKLNEEAIDKALECVEGLEFITALNTLAPTEKNRTRTLFEKHLKSYTSRNSFDYFIHKDLGGFLSRELDFYIKNEMLFLDDIMDSPIKYEEVMGKVKIFKEVSQKIIAFLTQLEELQKRLWEKKKFIIETNYCITLDKIEEKYHKEIFNNEAQLNEWSMLFGSEALASQNTYLNSIQGEAKASLPDELKYLVLDTKFFDMEFKYKLLSKFDNLDDEIDGVLINSENFGALNLLQERYKEQIKTVYIDPPYNKGNDFAYKDNYIHSSWFSMAIDRINQSNTLLTKNAIQWTSLDDNEAENFKLLLNNYSNFGEVKLLTAITNLKGIYDADGFVSTHEYIICATKSNLKSVGELKVSEEILLEKWSEDEYGYFKQGDGLKRTGADAPREKRPKGWFPIFVTNNNEIYVTDNDMPKADTDISIYPLGSKNEELSWSWSKTKITSETYNIIIKYDKKGNVSLYKKQRASIGDIPTRKVKSFLYKPEYSSTHGSNTAKDLFSIKMTDYTPKSVTLVKDLILLSSQENHLVLDFFAGSGTTGHAVINLNREDNGKRKYILVEMGEYFDTVTKPRIQKVIYSDSWKDGKPTTKNGISQIFKYFKLESYEDTLNNLEFKKTKKQNEALELYPKAKEDYMLNYSLDVESQASLLNIDSFKSPFNYKLKIATSSVGETKDTVIDLVETFNYLLGLVVEKTTFNDGFLTVKGKNLKGSKILVLWRDNKTSDDLDAFVKKISLDEFDEVYVNGDNHLEKAKLIEEEFKKLMFDE